MPEITVGLQLYTVRDECSKDFPGTLKKVAAIGYPAVEMAGLYGMEPEAVKEILDECGLAVAGSHESLDALTSDLRGVLQRNKALGNENIICPFAAPTRETDPAAWDRLAEQFNYIGRTCRDTGFTFAYHNHAHEFQMIDGQYGLDRLMDKTFPNLVKMEVDVGWAWYAGVDPAEYLRRHKGRVTLIHAKDHDAQDKDVNRPVGNGALDWEAIFAAARETGVEYAIVEEDKTIEPELHSVAISLHNLQQMGVA